MEAINAISSGSAVNLVDNASSQEAGYLPLMVCGAGAGYVANHSIHISCLLIVVKPDMSTIVLQPIQGGETDKSIFVHRVVDRIFYFLFFQSVFTIGTLKAKTFPLISVYFAQGK